MKKIPIILEQYECVACKKKWYINTEDKIDNEMMCPYGCRTSSFNEQSSSECKGNIVRKFDMMIYSYEEYLNDIVDGKPIIKQDGGKEKDGKENYIKN